MKSLRLQNQRQLQHPPTQYTDYETEQEGEVGEAPVARGGIPTKTPPPNQPAVTQQPAGDDDLGEQGQPPKGDSQEPEGDLTKSPTPSSGGQSEGQPDGEPDGQPGSQPGGQPDGQPENQPGETPDDSDYEYTTSSPFEETGEVEEERVKINFVTRAPTPGGPLAPTNRVTTTTPPRTKGF